MNGVRVSLKGRAGSQCRSGPEAEFSDENTESAVTWRKSSRNLLWLELRPSKFPLEFGWGDSLVNKVLISTRVNLIPQTYIKIKARYSTLIISGSGTWRQEGVSGLPS